MRRAFASLSSVALLIATSVAAQAAGTDDDRGLDKIEQGTLTSGQVAASFASRPLFQLPFPCGQVWGGDTYSGHESGNYALDFNRANDEGDPAVASAAGRATTGTDSSGGKFISINHGNGWTTYYNHFSSYAIPAGSSQVAQGQVIGYVGSTGNSTGPHLHYAQRYNNVAQHIVLNNVPAVYQTTPVSFTSYNCGGGESDFSGDGRADFVGVSDGRLYLYRGNGSGAFTGVQTGGPGWSGVQVGGAADYNADGRADFVGASDGRLYLYAGNGSGAFAGAQTGGPGWSGVQLGGAADFDEDGNADFVGVSDGRLYLYRGNGSGAFTGVQTGGPGWSGVQLGGAADYNGDGNADFVGVSDGRLYLYAGNGSGAFSGVQTGGAGWSGVQLGASGDFNNDTRADFVGESGGRLYLYLGNGSGAFSGVQTGGAGWAGVHLGH